MLYWIFIKKNKYCSYKKRVVWYEKYYENKEPLEIKNRECIKNLLIDCKIKLSQSEIKGHRNGK